MKTKIPYSGFDLKKGKCKCCGEKSNKILIDDGRCTDCIEEENFFEQIMRKRNKTVNIDFVRMRKMCLNSATYLC